MRIRDLLSGRKKKAQKLYDDGKAHETKGELDEAYEAYQQAAALDFTPAMTAIASLYISGSFRPVEKNNMMDLIMQGKPIFPWTLVTQKIPDYAAALSWLLKAAELNDSAGACTAGLMLCRGSEVSPDLEKGIMLLEKADALGNEHARHLLSLYRPAESGTYTDDAYEQLLKEFCSAAESGDSRCYDLYARLRSGSERQLARLGYVLSAAHCANDPHYAAFQTLNTPSGIPLIPAVGKRCNWKTFIRVDLNAFRSEDTLLAISSDIDASCILDTFHRLKPAGKASYRSPAFGWLGETKDAMLFQIDRSHTLDQNALQNVIERFMLIPEEYAENVAFIIESGEKEYSVEIAAITNDHVDVLFRYTIDGSDRVDHVFKPELLSIETEK